MHRFFVESSVQWSPGTAVSLSAEDSAHAARVLRLTPGDVIIICDGQGYEYEARMEQVTARASTARVTSGRPSTAEPNTHLTLIQGVAKGAKMDLIVQKAIEVGVSRIIPVTTRSEEHTSELQSRGHLVCRLLLEKKKTQTYSDGRYE